MRSAVQRLLWLLRGGREAGAGCQDWSQETCWDAEGRGGWPELGWKQWKQADSRDALDDFRV